MRKMKKTRLLSVAVVLCMLLALQGCGRKFKVEEADKIKEENLIEVGVSQLGSESAWRTVNTTSIRNAFSKENGYFLVFDNARQKQENQIKAVRSYISQQVDYILLSPIVEDGWDTVLQEAKEANIPVLLIDRGVKVKDKSLYTTRVGSNFEKEGRSAGEWLEKHLREKNREKEELQIVVLQGTKGATATIGRTKGFQKIANAHKNWKIVEQVDADFTTAKGKEEMHKILKKHKNIDVVIAQNDDMAFGAVGEIEKAGRMPGHDAGILVISYDGVKESLIKVQSGTINAVIECNPDQGSMIEKVVTMLESGDTVEKNYYVPEKVFTRENVDQFIDGRKY